jgi:hypothetical protein
MSHYIKYPWPREIDTGMWWEFVVLLVRGQKGLSKEELPLQARRFRGTDP